MVNQIQNIQIFFDLMNGLLGPKTEDIILKKNIPVFVKKLNCFMACVINKEDEVKYLLPIVLKKNKNWLTILATFQNKEKNATYLKTYNNECCEYKFDDNYYYRFNIEDYGYLILGRKKPFDKFFKFELKPVINFLGKSLLLAVERKKLEDSEKENYNEKQLLRTIIDNIPLHVYAKDTNNNRILSNETEIEYLGLETEKEVIGKSHDELFTNIKVSNLIRDDGSVYAGNSIINRQVEHYKNGEKLWFLHSKIPLKDENNAIVGLVGIALNITQQKRAEQEILNSNKLIKTQEEKYRNMISNINLGLLEVDMNDTIQFCNKGFEKTLGYSSNEIIGKKVQDLFQSDKYSEIIDKIRDSRILGNSDSYEILAKDKQGNLKWLLISGAPNYNDYGEIIGSIGVQLDITKQKKLERDLEKALSQSRKIAEAKELFLTNMSHEIRTPLNGIIGMIRELNKEIVSGQQKEYIKSAMKASRHLLAVVNSILDITKIEAGEFKMNYTHFSLPELLDDTISILKPQSIQKNIDLELQVNNGKSTVFIGDEVRIRQILINIAGNSIKFTEQGKVSIICTMEPIDSSHCKLCFTIKDTGIGMDKAYLKVLFEKFQQEDASISRKYGGTGLGMFISKQLLDLMGGYIEVESKKGIGSEFKVYIPLQLGDQSKVEKKQYKQDGKTLENTKVLLVEDNEINRLVTSNTLNIWNVNLTEVINGLEAVEILKKEHFDIILMDLQMPELNGFEATKIIREELHIKTPIIALSANVFKSEIDKCIAIGMNDYVTKPFEEQDLFNALVKYINIKKNDSTENKKELTNKNYDLTKLKEMSRGNQDFIQKMLQLFVDIIPVSVNEMNEMLNNKDYNGVGKIAHRIKPSLQNMGIDSLKKTILTIEKFDLNSNTIQYLTKLVKKVTLTLNDVVKKIRDVELKE